MNKITYIYALINPINNEVKYIGKTIDLERRYLQHCKYSKTNKTYCANWIKSLEPLKPEVIILEETFNWIEAERFWIAYFKFLGAKLANNCLGGEGSYGFKHTFESKNKISKSKKNLSEKSRKNLSLGQKGKTLSIETRLKISENTKKKMNTIEMFNRMSAFRKGRFVSDETKKKLSEAGKGKKFSEESKIKISEKAKLREKIKKEKGFIVSDETRLKLSIANKRRYELPVNDICW